MTKYLALLFLVTSFSAFAQITDYSELKPYPCKEPQSNSQIDMTNSDDLFFAGRFLVRAKREFEGIQCLNVAKRIAPAYLDVRLELLYAFIEIGDAKSAVLESVEFVLFPANQYYVDTYFSYRRKIKNINPVNLPRLGYSFLPHPCSDVGSEYRVIAGETIENEAFLKQAVELKHQSKFKAARKLIDIKVLPFNKASATVFMYSGLVFYDLNMPVSAEKSLKQALTYAYNDPDVILSISRALNAQSKFQASYSLLKANIAHFDNYGCFQLGSSLQKVFDAINTASAKKLDKIMLESLYSGTTDSQLCRQIEAEFF